MKVSLPIVLGTAALAALAAFALTGCAKPAVHPYDSAENNGNFVTRSPALVLDSPGMRYAPTDDPDAAPWWYDRNNTRLNVRNSTATSDVSDYAVQTIDRQQVNGNNVRDNYQRNFYSWRRGQIAR